VIIGRDDLAKALKDEIAKAPEARETGASDYDLRRALAAVTDDDDDTVSSLKRAISRWNLKAPLSAQVVAFIRQAQREAAHRAELKLEELAASLPYAVMVPDPKPHVLEMLRIFPEDERWGVPACTKVVYPIFEHGLQRGNLWVTLSAEPLPLIASDSWRAIEDMAVCEHSQGHYKCKVRLEREGTHVEVESDALGTLDEVIAVAKSLVRCPRR
jgi:hypothetical protein